MAKLRRNTLKFRTHVDIFLQLWYKVDLRQRLLLSSSVAAAVMVWRYVRLNNFCREAITFTRRADVAGKQQYASGHTDLKKGFYAWKLIFTVLFFFFPYCIHWSNKIYCGFLQFLTAWCSLANSSYTKHLFSPLLAFPCMGTKNE